MAQQLWIKYNFGLKQYLYNYHKRESIKQIFSVNTA